MEREVSELERILDGIQFGERVMIGYSEYSVPDKIFYYTVKWANEKGYRVVVVDILDTLYVYYQHLKLQKINMDVLNNIDVIKIGGRIKTGNVISNLDVPRSAAGEQEFSKIYHKIAKEGNVIIIVLGCEKIMMLFSDSKRGILNTINIMISYIGDQRVKGFYFINQDLMERLSPYITPMISEIMTTIIEMDKTDGGDTLRVMKSLNNDIRDSKLKLS